jgi:hypothetical protein
MERNNTTPTKEPAQNGTSGAFGARAKPACGTLFGCW